MRVQLVWFRSLILSAYSIWNPAFSSIAFARAVFIFSMFLYGGAFFCLLHSVSLLILRALFSLLWSHVTSMSRSVFSFARDCCCFGAFICLSGSCFSLRLGRVGLYVCTFFPCRVSVIVGAVVPVVSPANTLLIYLFYVFSAIRFERDIRTHTHTFWLGC